MNINFRLSFNNLPVWKGVQNKPNFSTAQFVIGYNRYNFIQQLTSSKRLQDIENRYSSKNYNFITQPPGYSQWANKLGKRHMDFIERVYKDMSQKRILEIGAGSLSIANYFSGKARVKRYTVVDPAIKEKETKKIEVIKEYFHRSVAKNKYDLVICFNTLEHVLDPRGFLLGIKAVLETGTGRVVLGVPDIEEPFKNGDLNALLHEHINYFTFDMVVSLLKSLGFEVLASENKNNSQFFFLKVNHLLNKENGYINDLLPLAAHKLLKNIAYVSKKINQEIKRGKKIILHGACNGLNNFIYLSQISDIENITVFDGDLSKEGKYLPVFNKPIIYFGNPIYRQYDEVYIAAITFFDEIRNSIIKMHSFPEEKIHPLFPLL